MTDSRCGTSPNMAVGGILNGFNTVTGPAGVDISGVGYSESIDGLSWIKPPQECFHIRRDCTRNSRSTRHADKHRDKSSVVQLLY